MTSHEEIVRLGGAWGGLDVHLAGAVVSSWRPRGREALFASSGARHGGHDMWHGGIPVCAPWFGSGTGTWHVPFLHGLTPRVRWDVVSTACDDEGASATLATHAAAMAHLPGADRFPPDLRFELDVAADDLRLTLGLTLTSPSRDAVVEMAMHPYLLTDAPTATLSGLEGVRFDDYSDGSTGRDRQPVRLGRSIDRVYAAAPATTLASEEGVVRFASHGAASMIVWNPGPASSQVPRGEWERFVCVEYGCVKEAATLIPAGGSHLLRLTIEAGQAQAAHAAASHDGEGSPRRR